MLVRAFERPKYRCNLLDSIVVSTVVVVASSAGVRCTIRLTTGLDPDKGIGEGITSVGARSKSETSSLGVAPVSPSLLAGRLLAGAALVDEELGAGPALLLEERRQGVDVLLLVVVGVALGVVGLGGELPGVVVGNVGDETSESGRLAGVLVDVGVQLGGRGKVGGPSEPATVTGVEVHGDMGEVKLLDGVDGELLVGRLGLGTLGSAQDGADVRVLLKNALDLGNVGLVLVLAVVVKGVFSVGSSGSAVALRKIVDNKLTGVVGTSLVGLGDISEGVLHQTDVLEGVPRSLSKDIPLKYRLRLTSTGKREHWQPWQQR
ncbi:hypothetical protein HG530_014962 [Fusarium avenaceum]|nr:hypothetical protein HG530_014962 [Fusarium avenaceum]